MKKRILIVEDNDINRLMLSGIISTEYEVVEAANGKEAMEILAQQYARISLIMLDIVMPVMDGYAFLAEMKKNANFASIPVIVATEKHSEEEEIAALSHGATEFVVKPYQPQIILHRIASILELRAASAMVDQLQYDRLTGLYSKDYFFQCAREVRENHPEKVYAVICTNVENFHMFNDRFGMEAGDNLLKEIARIYRSIFPREKVLVSRFYADYFMIMAEYEKNDGDRLITWMNEVLRNKFGSLNVAVKWGIYLDEDRSKTIEKMCDNATMAVRSIKEHYGVNFAFFNRELKTELMRQQEIMEVMEQALQEEQFLVYLQPKVRAGEVRWSDAEALVRWVHPEKGMMSPAEFIPVFERTRFIVKLDRYVWKKTCELLRCWEDAGLGKINVSVNVSRVDAFDDSFVDYLQMLVKTYEIDPSQLHLEITETVCTENFEEFIKLIETLRNSGFVIEMDDFGSGYSSLNMLTKMPLDILKLDRELIQNECSHKGGLRFIIGLAHWMNLKVVAEGVETKEQLEYMLQLGCDYIQGYYTARPMPWQDFERLLKQQRKEELA